MSPTLRLSEVWRPPSRPRLHPRRRRAATGAVAKARAKARAKAKAAAMVAVTAAAMVAAGGGRRGAGSKSWMRTLTGTPRTPWTRRLTTTSDRLSGVCGTTRRTTILPPPPPLVPFLARQFPLHPPHPRQFSLRPPRLVHPPPPPRQLLHRQLFHRQLPLALHFLSRTRGQPTTLVSSTPFLIVTAVMAISSTTYSIGTTRRCSYLAGSPARSRTRTKSASGGVGLEQTSGWLMACTAVLCSPSLTPPYSRVRLASPRSWAATRLRPSSRGGRALPLTRWWRWARRRRCPPRRAWCRPSSSPRSRRARLRIASTGCAMTCGA
mmetsp:Transcript_11017/g.23049  ORF Transcript_11017/g.23049 Transcript_11017/m.23049 type:complete len:322 (-) Transcript_11017:1918-2883(-)